MKSFLINLFLLTAIIASAQTTDKKIVINDSTTIVLVEKPFIAKQHHIIYGENNTIFLIDNYLVYGTDATMPINTLTEAKLVINIIPIDLDISGMYDPNIELLNNNSIYFKKTFNGYILRAVFSVGAGYFGVEWTIVNGKSYRTIITNNIDILDNHFIDKRIYKSVEEPK